MTTIKRTCLPSRQPRIGRATAVRGLATNLPVRVAPTTAEDAAAAIDAIERQNHHLFVDRDHSGRVRWSVNPDD